MATASKASSPISFALLRGLSLREHGRTGILLRWEKADSVSAIFELADLLVDLQGFAKTDIEANERAIRQLDLSPDQAQAAKIALDEITSAIETIPEVVTERVETTFANAAILSQTSIETDVKTAVEGERILLTENLALSVARSIGGSWRRKAARRRRAPAREASETQKASSEANGTGATTHVG